MSTESTWRSQSGFVWSLIGSAVGFANVLSFSAQVYKNGGGAFLIPYALALFILGIPFLILEGKIGSHWKKPLISAYESVWGKTGKMLGWLSVIACLTIGAFYIVLTGYSAAYTFFASTGQIPDDTGFFFLHSFLQTTPSLTDFGSFSVPIFIATLAVGLIAWQVLIRNVRDGIERVCSIFMPLLVVIMAFFAIAVCFLPGGLQGWVYYLKPDFAKLLDIGLWRDVFGQLFFSLSLGLGIIVGYSRYTGESPNLPKAMFYVALGDFFVSLISGAALMGCLAHVSYMSGVPFEKVLTSDSTFEIGFILFPKILKSFGPLLEQGIGTLFFFCIFIAGITGVFSIIESIAGNVEVEFQTSRKKAVGFSIAVILAMALLFCMGNAGHIIDALAPMVLGINMLIGGLALIIAFHFNKRAFPKGKLQEKKWHGYCLSLAFWLLSAILIGNFMHEFAHFDLAKGNRWIWFAVALVFAAGFSLKTKKMVEKIS